MSQKTVGIIGGLGPMATIAFMNSVLELTPIESERDHLHMLVDCNPKVPDINAAILGTGPGAAAALVENAKRLESAGADLIVMVCNAAHVYERELKASVSVPFISMIEETVRSIRSDFPRCTRVGLLGTKGCLQSEIYQERLAGCGLTSMLQAAGDQEHLMHALARIKAGDRSVEVRSEIFRMVSDLAQSGAEAIILGCSEISLVGPIAELDVPLIDPCVALAQATVHAALKQN
ncbi:aspartate/glutamate racemase family protein [Sinorhizobium terangae]|uniref:aspartate/glutamate racemase family protein n=1 Tax=Sinorhizobium terangae TaxID=110322 RepID=UPI0024B1A9AF|nr:amino acid racemase [Sinorhizobium terangae]WFU49126.1 amino acid racemase [Sinorhizobium terangae]